MSTSDDITAATQEAFASAREGIRIWDTLELWHTDWASTLRVVNDTDDQDFVLEFDAPRNAGTAQTFNAFSFSVALPKRGEIGRQELEIQIDNVSLEAFNLIRTSDASNGAVQIIYRLFCNAEPGQPSRVHSLYVKSISVNAQSISLQCVYADHVNRKFPSLTYDQTNFPGIFR